MQYFKTAAIASALALAVSLTSDALAQNSPCRVGVRLISARQTAIASPGVVDAQMTSFLADVRDQLANLPFSSYKPIKYVEGNVPLNQRAAFVLPASESERHTVYVQPHELSSGKVKTTIEWEGPSGESLVSTRMRVVNGENVILGTDPQSGAKSCRIISVRIDCR